MTSQRLPIVASPPPSVICLLPSRLRIMELTQADIEEFKELWRREVGERLTNEQAALQANRILSLYRVLYRPYPTESPTVKAEHPNE